MANSSQAYISKNLGDLLETFQVPTDASERVEITNVQTVASYSWVEAPTPTIVVPASPRVWSNGQRRIKLSPDRGYFNADETEVRMGKLGSTLTPIFAALDHLHPSKTDTSEDVSSDGASPVDLRSIDVVCERNALRKLYRLANFDKKDRKGWRIDVELGGKTCLFTSIQAAKKVYLKGNSGCGYGYEKASTFDPGYGVETTQHHRITKLSFGDVIILLRYEVDACILPAAKPKAKPTSRELEKSSSPSPKFPQISIISSGVLSAVVPQSCLLEIKTRTLAGEIDWREIWPQLFLSQTPNLYIARHQQGLFSGTSVTKYDMTSPGLEKAAKAAEKPMARMHELLRTMINIIRKHGEGVGMALTYDGKELALYKRKQGTGREVGSAILSRFNDDAA
ncbi:hypothetical protein FRB90_003444 [Tulasnella sp. 427]|nr:hypothetical protein FRB90_003444 [Tulasnella sp. 427]